MLSAHRFLIEVSARDISSIRRSPFARAAIARFRSAGNHRGLRAVELFGEEQLLVKASPACLWSIANRRRY